MIRHTTAVLLLGCLVAGLSQSASAHPPKNAKEVPLEKQPDFVYDQPDATVTGTVLENAMWYEGDLLSTDDGLRSTWLEYRPGQGDIIHLGTRQDGKWAAQHQITEKPGSFANPTLTRDAAGRIWLSYEANTGEGWNVLLLRLEDGRPAGKPRRISPSSGADINHAVVALPDGGLWFVWQSDQGGQFDVLARQVSPETMTEPVTVGNHSHGDWHPNLAVGPNGTRHIVWDAYDGETFNVYRRSFTENEWSPIQTVAASPAFEGRAEVAVDANGRVWIAWEEGGTNWGESFRGIHTPKVRDESGPLHRFRLLHVGILGPKGEARKLADPLPMPSLEEARSRQRQDLPEKKSGTFYERVKLTVDESGRLWVAYRHYYTPWLGFQHRSHVEGERGIYARYFGEDGWSKLYQLKVGQGDGLQRLELTPHQDGMAAVWTTGRTDRRRLDRPHGMVVASVSADAAPAEKVELAEAKDTASNSAKTSGKSKSETKTTKPKKVNDERYQLFYGDLHRHTDLSLCRVPIDGTIDDAYRYAIEVAGLDYLGITDHSRDIDRGDRLSQLWWRSRKEVYRHQLGTTFFPFFAYERSHGNTADHNVISLKGDMLRPHTYPVPEFWKELDENTITIPHQPIRRDTWKYQNDRLRPLVEIFQGCRDNSIEKHVHQGLEKGYHLGFIASSDHMSTSASYACVWAEDASREAIFRALQDRRTFGATTTIRLKVQAGQHWMGEKFQAETMPALQLEALGTAPIRRVELRVDGKTIQSWNPEKPHVMLKHRPELTGEHYVYFYLQQDDGNEAWSSPLWVNVGAKTSP